MSLHGPGRPLIRVCPEDPRVLAGAPIGQYHCPACGCMVIAALPHLEHDEGCWMPDYTETAWGEILNAYAMAERRDLK